MKFRQQFNAFDYAVQNEHQNITARRLALQSEENSALKRYIMNLRDEIGSQVKPLKPLTLSQVQQEALESETRCGERN